MLGLDIRRRRYYRAPVKEEKTVEFIARNLYGAAKEAWLQKWARWVDELIHRYNVEDVQKALGIIDVHDLEELEKFLVENCSGLTESECLDRIRVRLKEQGYRENVTDEMIQSLMDYVKTVEKQPEIEYGFPSDIKAEVSRLRARPELDHEAAFKLVYDFLTKEGVPEDEAKKIAEEIAATIPKLPPAKRKDIYEYAVTQAKLAKQTSLERWFKREREAERVAREAKEDMRKDDWIPLLGARIVSEVQPRIEKKLARKLTPAERERLRKIVFSRLQELYDEGLSYDEAEKLFKQLVDEAEKEFYDTIPLYKKLKEVLAARKPYRPYVEVVRPEKAAAVTEVKREELIKGANIYSLDTLAALGIHVTPAVRTRTVEETVKAIEDWAKARGLSIDRVSKLRFNRTELRRLYIVYYRDRRPTACRIDCHNSVCDFLGCDKEVVAYLVRGNTCYIVVPKP